MASSGRSIRRANLGPFGMETLRPGARGGDVAALFQQLAERGIPVDPAELAQNWYGPKTVGCVHDFQVKHALGVDDVVGPRTWGALNTAPDTSTDLAVAPFALTNPSPLIAKMLNLAWAEYKRPVLEEPMGANRGARVDDFLRGHDNADWLLTGPPGPPWCGRFARWVAVEAARQIGAKSPVEGWGDVASAIKWVARGKAATRFWQQPTVGSIGCIVTDGHGHLVVVVSPPPSPTAPFMTIEGNSGNRVAFRNTRTIKEFVGFVTVAL